MMLKLIYLTKCIIDLTVYPSLKIASIEIPPACLIKALQHTCNLQAHIKLMNYACLMENIRNVPESTCNRKSLEYLFSNQLSSSNKKLSLCLP